MPSLFDGFEGYRILSDSDTDDALRSALVAVDANVLLNLYRYNTQTTNDLLAIFQRLGDRLVIPHQSIREFHRNRLSAIGNPDTADKDVRSSVQKNHRSTIDALARWAKQVALPDTELQHLLAELETAFGQLLEAVIAAEPDRVHADTPAADDRVLHQLAILADGKVLPRPSDEDLARLIAEGRERVERQQPPGYLDADKDDEHPEGPAGDFLVYIQACEEAKRRGLDLVIITGDEKEDWWWRHRSAVIGPRQEMVKEFFDLTGGHRLFLLRPRDLLLRSSVFEIEVDPTSLEDASRRRDDLVPVGTWTPEAVAELLRRLDIERAPQADVIREAAVLGGTIDRDTVYGLCGFTDERVLRGFTRPAARITTDLQQEGVLAAPVVPMLKALYPDGVRASGFRIPPEVVLILVEEEVAPQGRVATDREETDLRTGKYAPLTAWLRELVDDSISLTFREVEEIIDDDLAPSARKHPPYWYSSQNSLGWAAALAGFKASKVSLAAEQVTFVRRRRI